MYRKEREGTIFPLQNHREKRNDRKTLKFHRIYLQNQTQNCWSNSPVIVTAAASVSTWTATTRSPDCATLTRAHVSNSLLRWSSFTPTTTTDRPSPPLPPPDSSDSPTNSIRLFSVPGGRFRNGVVLGSWNDVVCAPSSFLCMFLPTRCILLGMRIVEDAHQLAAWVIFPCFVTHYLSILAVRWNLITYDDEVSAAGLERQMTKD